MRKDEALRILMERRDKLADQLSDQNEYTTIAWVPKAQAELDAMEMAIAAVDKQPDDTRTQTLFIKTKFPSLNEVIRVARGNKGASADLKKTLTQLVGWECRAQKIRPVERAHFTLIWTETSQQRNMDNIASAKKFIFDGLQLAGVIKNDGWKQIAGFTDEFRVGKECSVEVIISEVR